ncbi:hypothetical protein KKB11_06340, partial [Candidatus Micrarchaeota archaeon]|nr:hypothetical protein [Candidatus Micrarchaeota archaeon]
MNQTENSDNYHKKFFKQLSPEEISEKAIKESIRKVKDKQELREKVIEKGQYTVLILGENEKEDTPSEKLLKLQDSIWKEGFPCCTIGSQYYKIGKKLSDQDIQQQMLEESNLIILVNSNRPGVVDESKAIRKTKEWKRKTLFFFEYEDYEDLVSLARSKQYPIDFKFPIPYKGFEELKAKVLFGVHHFYMYTIK